MATVTGSYEVTVVVPAYDEVASIVGTLAALHRHLTDRGLAYEIIVSADGDDGTRSAARSAPPGAGPVVVLGSRARRGKGRAVREAVARARGAVVGYVDADDKTPIDHLDEVRARIADGADLVIGSRALPGAAVTVPAPRHRRVGSRAFASVVHGVVGLADVPDTQCGFKFLRGDVARELFAVQEVDGYMFDVELLARARARGHRIDQIPVRWHADGDSRSRPIRTAPGHLRDLLRIRRAVSGGADRGPR